MKHAFVISDLAGVEKGEVLMATPKKYVPAPVGTIGTAEFSVPGAFELADFLMGGDCLLKVYQEDGRIPTGRRLATHQRLLSAVEGPDKDGAWRVSTSWVSPFWVVLLKRIIGKSTTGYVNGTAVAPVDVATIIADLLIQANAVGPSGLGPGTITATGQTTYVKDWFYKKAGEGIVELCGSLGPDYRVRPQEYAAGVIGLLDVALALGASKPAAALEHGDGERNVKTFTRAVSHEGTANKVYSLPPGFPGGGGAVLTDQDAASQAARGVLEDLVGADLTVDALRQALLAYHIATRKTAKQTIQLSPVNDRQGSLPLYGVDWCEGDVLPFASWARLAGKPRRLRLDLSVRVYQAAFDVRPDGSADPSLTVTA